MVRGYLPLISVYLRFPRNLSISNYSYFIKLNGCCVGKVNRVGGPGFEPGSSGCRFPSYFQMIIMYLDCGIELPLDLFGFVCVRRYFYCLMHTSLDSSDGRASH